MKYKVSLKDKDFLKAVASMKEGDKLTGIDGSVMVCEAKFTRPTHFTFHQRIFDAGVILKKEGSNVRVHVPADLIGMKAEEVKEGEYDDRQIVDGKVLPADRGVLKDKVK